MFIYPLMRWLPRVLAIGFALFLSIFALDVVTEYKTFGDVFVALNMHLLPTYLILVALIIAWQKHIIGGLVFILLGLLSVIVFNTDAHLLTIVLISLPPIVIGILFMLEPEFNYPKNAHYH